MGDPMRATVSQSLLPTQLRDAARDVPVLHVEVAVLGEGDAVRRGEDPGVLVLGFHAEIRPLLAVRVVAFLGDNPDRMHSSMILFQTRELIHSIHIYRYIYCNRFD